MGQTETIKFIFLNYSITTRGRKTHNGSLTRRVIPFIALILLHYFENPIPNLKHITRITKPTRSPCRFPWNIKYIFLVVLFPRVSGRFNSNSNNNNNLTTSASFKTTSHDFFFFFVKWDTTREVVHIIVNVKCIAVLVIAALWQSALLRITFVLQFCFLPKHPDKRIIHYFSLWCEFLLR